MIVGTFFIELLLESLTPKRKLLLGKLVNFNGTASQFVASIDLPKSTIWHNLRVLQKKGLITLGHKENIKLDPSICRSNHQQIIGIVGGFGPETTAVFFSKLLELSRKRGCKPKLVIANAAVPNNIENKIINGDVKLAMPFAKECIDKLNMAGVHFTVIPCNTLHLFIDDFRQSSQVPIISIIDETIAELKQRKISRIGLLATTATINSGMFQKALSKEKIQVITPNNDDQKIVVNIINNVLKTGIPCKTDIIKLNKVIKNLKNKGIETILLACTDLQLLISKSEGVQVIDTLEILANSVVNLISNSAGSSMVRAVGCNPTGCLFKSGPADSSSRG